MLRHQECPQLGCRGEVAMLIRKPFLEGIREGRITLAFRRWRRPTVRAGGSLLTAAGRLEIRAVGPVARERITDAEAGRAGYASKAELLADLDARSEGEIYRIELGTLEADPRIALRNEAPTDPATLADIARRLGRMDARAAKPWTGRVLALVAAHPDRRAADLCTRAGMDKEAFKVNVRKLKHLGLTESRETGYRLSPRGRALLDHLQRGGAAGSASQSAGRSPRRTGRSQ
jgi:hypothetical protein